MRVVVMVDGGNVQGVWTDGEDVDLDVIDFDNLRAPEESEEALEDGRATIAAAEKHLKQIY